MGTTKQSFCVVTELNVEHIGLKVAIPHNNVCCVSTSSLEEANFVCGILNSNWVADFVNTRTGKSKYPWAAKMMQKIPIPQFDVTDSTHQEIASLSSKIHELAKNAADYQSEETKLNQLVPNVM